MWLRQVACTELRFPLLGLAGARTILRVQVVLTAHWETAQKICVAFIRNRDKSILRRRRGELFTLICLPGKRGPVRPHSGKRGKGVCLPEMDSCLGIGDLWGSLNLETGLRLSCLACPGRSYLITIIE